MEKKRICFDDLSRQVLQNDSKVDAFISYMKLRLEQNVYQQRKEREAINSIVPDKAHLQLLIDNLVKGEYQFDYPEKILINKMKTKKNRTVYVYYGDDKCLLQYINFVINDLVTVHERCYSFQKNKDIRQSLKYLMNLDTQGYVCIKTDISNYFNSIPIEKNNDWLRKNLKKYPAIAATIENLITCPYVYISSEEEIHKVNTREEGIPELKRSIVEQEVNKGVMAGMPLAPTLSNIYLHSFDEKMSCLFHGYARYSDDMVFFCKGKELEDAMTLIRESLNEEGLTLNMDKTKIFNESEGFEFLGLAIQHDVIDLSPSTIMKIKRKMKRATRSLYRWQVSKQVPYEKSVLVLIRKFNGKFYGFEDKDHLFTWARWFFPLINTSEGLREIDKYFQETIRFLATGSYKKINYKHIPYTMLQEKGYKPLVSAYYGKNK